MTLFGKTLYKASGNREFLNIRSLYFGCDNESGLLKLNIDLSGTLYLAIKIFVMLGQNALLFL